MNYLKVQQNLLKAADARDGWKHKNFNIYYFTTEDKVWMCPKGEWMIGVPKNQFYLDIDKIWKDVKPVQGETFLKDTGDLKPAVDTNSIVQVTICKKKKMNLHKFVVDNEAIYVQEEYLKFFDPDATFKGTKHNAPLYVYENGELVGLILPVNHKEGSED